MVVSQAERELYQDIYQEVLEWNPVYREITYRRYVSKSKGGQRNKVVKGKNGKIYGPYPHYGPYKRKHWREVRLVRYRGGFYEWHKFPFDEFCDEILGPNAESEDLKDEIIKLWGY